MKDTEPKTALDALKLWDKGETLWSIEMGGIGTSYEQAIQIIAMEIIRDHGREKIVNDRVNYRKWAEDTASRVDKIKGLGGFTGAMWGGAKELAFRAIRDGWAKRNDSAREQFKEDNCDDRMIQIRKGGFE